MVGDNHRNIAPLQPLSAQPHHTVLGAQDRFRRGGTQGTDRFGADGLKLAEKELAADLHLVRLRSSILWGTALNDVADVNVLAFQGDAFFGGRPFDHLREKLSGPADERQALRVLVGPWAFAYKHQSRLFIAGAKHDPVPALMQATPFAVSNIIADFQ